MWWFQSIFIFYVNDYKELVMYSSAEVCIFYIRLFDKIFGYSCRYPSVMAAAVL